MKGFVAKYNRQPTVYASQGYDTAKLIGAALKATGGKLDENAFRAAMMKADVKLTRGPFKFNRNHQPIHNTYVTEVDSRPDGSLYLKQIGIAAENAQDEFVGKCPMK